MVGNLSLKLLLLDLNWLIGLAGDTLGENFSQTGSLDNLNKDLVALFNQAKAESGKTELGNGTVVKDLVGNILEMDGFSEMSLEQKLTALVEATVKTVMISLAEVGTDLHL